MLNKYVRLCYRMELCTVYMNKQEIQECIPVGCVLSTAVAISEGSVRLGVSAQGVSAQGGVCRGASVGVSAREVSAQGVSATPPPCEQNLRCL